MLGKSHTEQIAEAEARINAANPNPNVGRACRINSPSDRYHNHTGIVIAYRPLHLCSYAVKLDGDVMRIDVGVDGLRHYGANELVF